jgi:arylsulfatase A-like enzyme
LVNCDDLGYGDLTCYGSKRNDTPHLDWLAKEGMRFTDFYMAAPVCSASRAAMPASGAKDRKSAKSASIKTPDL